jgi:hypothetical protein
MFRIAEACDVIMKRFALLELFERVIPLPP